MPPPTLAQDQTMRKTLGVWLGSGGQADDADQLKASLASIYKKVDGLPWVPPTWLAAVTALQSANPDGIVLPSPVVGNNPIPAWIATPEQRAFWTALVQQTNEARAAYGAKLAAKGKVILDRLYADAAFWDRAYRIAVALDPARAVGGALNNLFGSMGGFTKVVVVGVVIVGGLYFVSKIAGNRPVAIKANPGKRRKRRRAKR